MSDHQKTHIHKRYYVFSHINGDKIEYRFSTGDWTDDFYRAMLWDDEEFAVKKSVEYAKEHRDWMARCENHPEKDRRFVVGCVRVEVDPLYPMKVAEK